MFPKTKTERLAAPVIEQCMKLDELERYELFHSYVGVVEEVCLLKGQQGFLMLNTAGVEQLPIFPHRDLALDWLSHYNNDQKNNDIYNVEVVGIGDFVEVWLPGLGKNNIDVVVFPSSRNEASQQLNADELLQDLSDSDDAS